MQLGEALYGSIPIIAQAYGFSNDQKGEEDFFKAMERGELKATEDKFLAFAKGLSEVANANGALEAVTKKTRAEMNRFFNQLTIGKDTIFGSGMGEGLAYTFGSFSNTLKNMQPTLVALGGLFKGFFSILTAGINGIMLPIMGFGNLIGSIFGKDGATVIGALAGGALMVNMLGKMAAGFIALRKALASLSIVWAASPMGLMTRVLAVGGAVAAGYGANALMNGNTFGTPESAKQKVEVSIGYKTEEAKKLIDAQINTRNASTIQDLSMQTGGV